MEFYKFNINDFKNNRDTSFDKFIELYNDLEIKNTSHWLAGGIVRRAISNKKLDSDWDFFFHNKTDFDIFIDKTKAMGGEFLSKTKNNQSFVYRKNDYTYTIQAINVQYYETLEHVLDTFDFTICQFGLLDEDTIMCGNFSLYDLGRKRLVVNKVTYGISTIRRLIKYSKQGFYACDGTISTIAQSLIDNPEIANTDIVSPD